jgi:hypothetical protein
VPQGRPVEVEEQEEILARVAAIDVGKASGMVCTRVPHEAKAGKRVTTVWEVAATTSAIMELADRLVCQGSSESWWSPPRTTGGRLCTCSRPTGCWCGWSTRVT